jgi:hypothetical protein
MQTDHSGQETPLAEATGSTSGRAAHGPRILLLAPQTNWIFQNLIPSLRRLSGAVYALPFGDGMGNWHIPRWQHLREKLMARAVSEISAIARGPGLDLVLCLLLDDSLHPGDVRAIRGLGVKVVNYHVDMATQWYRVLRHAGELDLLAVAHQENLQPFARAGVPLHFMPMAASPDRFQEGYGEGASRSGVLMLGSASRERVRAVAACCEVASEVSVAGRGWEGLAMQLTTRNDGIEYRAPQPVAKRLFDVKYIAPRLRWEGPRRPRASAPLEHRERESAARAVCRGPVSDREVAPLMNHAAITLGVNQRVGGIGDRHGFADSRLRDFEAPMAGAFYLVQDYLDLPLFYRPGEEVATWSTLPELRAKVTHYLAHPEERARIAAAGQQRARSDHTWDVRLRALFHRLGIAPSPSPEASELRIPVNLSSRLWCLSSPGCALPLGAEEAAEPRLPEIAATI